MKMDRREAHILLVLAIVGVLLAGIYFFVGVTPDRVVRTLAHSGEIQLRDEMRPPGAGPRVVIFAVDGLGEAQFEEVLQRGGAPVLQSLLGDSLGAGRYDAGHAFRNALTILPSSTMGAWVSIFTGEPAGWSGVPGNEWFDRRSLRFFAPAPVSVKDHKHTVDMLLDNLLGDVIEVPTLFEQLDRRSHVSLMPVHRGADLFTTPDPVAVAELFVHVARGVAGVDDSGHDSYAAIDERSVSHLLSAIEDHGVPDLQVVYLPGLDLFSHVTADVLNRQVMYFSDVIDPLIGSVLEVYRDHGVLDETFVFLISDHGHTPVLDDDAHAIQTEEEDPPGLMERNGYRVRPFATDVSEEDFQAVLAYQGAMAFIYLADRSSCAEAGTPCDWARAPRFEEDVLPLAKAFFDANETGAGLPKLKGTLEMVLSRRPAAPGDEQAPFQVFDGTGLVPLRQWVDQHGRHDLVDLEGRMNGLAVGPAGFAAGDIVLMTRSGLERPVTERFYFSDLYRSWHGSATAQDGYIPFVIAHGGGDGDRVRGLIDRVGVSFASQLDLVPLVKAAFDQD